MLDPKFVGEAMSVIAANTNAAVTVKCRIGVDDHDSYNELCKFFLPRIFQVLCGLKLLCAPTCPDISCVYFQTTANNNFCRVHILHV